MLTQKSRIQDFFIEKCAISFAMLFYNSESSDAIRKSTINYKVMVGFMNIKSKIILFYRVFYMFLK